MTKLDLKLDKNKFKNFCNKILQDLETDEKLTMTLNAESTQFTRFNQSKVRQSTNLTQAFIEFNFIKENKTLNFNLPYLGEEQDLTITKKFLAESRTWFKDLPEDPFIVYPSFTTSSIEESLNDSNCHLNITEQIINNTKDLDLNGSLCVGEVVRATANSAMQFHWFKTQNFYLDYSLYKNEKAIKALYAEAIWNEDNWLKNLNESKFQLSLMNTPPIKIKKGKYRVYFAPAAVSELLTFLSWGGFSMGDHQKGSGAFKDLWKGSKKLSPMITLTEDFSLGLVPRFNQKGEISPTKIPLIENGLLKNFLISSRTGAEYKTNFNMDVNFASDEEGMRSPNLKTGNLKQENILKELNTGLYISNLHYLNWSDQENARVTGMTRYACFWVENGKIVAPIEDLRFDESYYSFLGDELIAITDYSEIVPQTGSYSERELGGAKVPGILVSKFEFTL